MVEGLTGLTDARAPGKLVGPTQTSVFRALRTPRGILVLWVLDIGSWFQEFYGGLQNESTGPEEGLAVFCRKGEIINILGFEGVAVMQNSATVAQKQPKMVRA